METICPAVVRQSDRQGSGLLHRGDVWSRYLLSLPPRSAAFAVHHRTFASAHFMTRVTVRSLTHVQLSVIWAHFLPCKTLPAGRA